MPQARVSAQSAGLLRSARSAELACSALALIAKIARSFAVCFFHIASRSAPVIAQRSQIPWLPRDAVDSVDGVDNVDVIGLKLRKFVAEEFGRTEKAFTPPFLRLSSWSGH